MGVYRSGRCKCGNVSIAIDMKPFLAYNCHCSHCRGFASKYQSKPARYSGGGAVWKWNVTIQGSENIDYERSTSLGGLFAMSRGRCSQCHQTIWESGERVIFPFAMVMAEPLLGLKPDTEIFYNSGYKDWKASPNNMVVHSDIGSLMYEIYLIVFVAIPMIPWSLFKRMMRGDPFANDVKQE
ncbi:unnamed protein product [Cylindrotheca closterium]|uniref:CENP-V/GFA domain-containing protein n=1 Tax=Cylindrotheca closterium TaxID=2856 RepID=A0AAD2GCW4_9STRA|nr:unnamed protein product [Cylindrotheca closterium]